MKTMMTLVAAGAAMMLGTTTATMAANDLAADRVVRDWVVIGPFESELIVPPVADAPTRAGWDRDYLVDLGGESKALLQVGDTVVSNGESFVAVPASSTSRWGTIDLITAFPDHGTAFANTIAYGAATFTVPEGGDYVILMGADDAAKLWVNGAVGYDTWRPGGGLKPREFVIPVKLPAGENRLLVKVEQQTGPWAFAIEIVPADEKDLVMSTTVARPAEFSAFDFAGHDEQAALLSNYLWYFFKERIGHFHALFMVEYMMKADIWLAGADVETGSETISVQERKRRDLEAIVVDPDGYVQTHQHFSHAHDGGWPFPLYPQDMGTFAGRTWGWHWGGPKAGSLYQHMLPPGDARMGEKAIEGWVLENAVSKGLVIDAWEIQATGKSPALVTPEAITLTAFNNPFMQLRWRCEPGLAYNQHATLEWKREGDSDWSADRRVAIFPEESELSQQTGMWHSHIRLYDHPNWTGRITRIRLNLAPGRDDVTLRLIDFFSVYDTRKPYNNLHFVIASWDYFRWTGDVVFLRNNIERLRKAYQYARRELHVDEVGNARITWPGHDGLSGWNLQPDGTKTGAAGHGIGNNYYDILPFGYDDMYLTTKYYKAVIVMAELEEAVANNPEWRLWPASPAIDPAELRAHAARVKRTAHEKFWDEEKGRYIACVDINGKAWDFGYTFLPLEAIWFGMADDDSARTAMDWISGRRIIEGDTSQGADIYHFRFGPRATTKRNIEWYSQGWQAPEALKFGEQIQDGGAVLGFTFYDLYARLQVYGPDDAWARFEEIMAWEKEARAAGGYREYYKKQGVVMQGGGTAGGIGVDFEFLESALPPSIVPYGFLGLDAQPDHLAIAPRLPSTVPTMTLRNVLYHGNRMDISASADRIAVTLHDEPLRAIAVKLPEGFAPTAQGRAIIDRAGVHEFTRTPSTN